MTTQTFEARVAAAYNAATEEPQYRTDVQGRTVRVFTKENPLSWEDVRHFYMNRRVVEEDECLEAIGYNGFRTQVASGNIRKMSGFYWVTKKAATRYKLPRPVVANGAVCDFAE